MSCSTTITVLPASTSHRAARPAFRRRRDAGRWWARRGRRAYPALDSLQLGGELDALGLAAGELGGRLAEPQIAQAHFAQRRSRERAHAAARRRRTPRPRHRHPEDVGDGLVAIFDLQRLGVVASAVTGRARCVDAGKEEQFDHTKPSPSQFRSGPWRTLNEKRPAS